MISFREVNIEDAEKILSWRTKPRVTKYMNTDVDGNVESQENWLKNCLGKNDYYHWIVQVNSVDVGLISLSDYDEASGTTSWGFYIGHDDYLGVGAFVPLYLYNFIFKSSNVNKITAEVFYDNTNTIKLHTLHGYKFESDKCRVIRKNDKEVLLVAMSLTRDDFLSRKKGKYQFDFPMNKANFSFYEK